MEQQNFKNHGRLVFGYHFLTGGLLLIALIGSLINVVKSSAENLYSAMLIVLVILILFLVAFYARTFALKAQDRAIKAEENFRYYRLTGKPFDPKLRMRQIIGLRFASDEEFVALVKRAVDEKLTEKEIKKSIVNWKANTYRV